MKKFIVNIIVFAILLVLSSLCLDMAVSKGLRKNKTKLFATFSKVYRGKINADLIINGSSKAFVQVDPMIIDSITGINSYNLGLDGNPFIPQKALYELYKLNNVKPKVIVQVVSNGTLRSINKGFLNPIKFAPYINIPIIKKHMKLTSEFNYLDYKIPLFKYSSSPFEVITGVLSLFNINLLKHNDNKGYSPHDKDWSKNSKKTTTIKSKLKDKTSSLDSQKINEFKSLDVTSCALFEEFLADCKLNNITLFLVYPPIHSSASKSIRNVNYYNQLARKYNAIFLDYSRDSTLVFNKENFYNSQHLNIKGATIFTNKLAKDIKTQMHNKKIR